MTYSLETAADLRYRTTGITERPENCDGLAACLNAAVAEAAERFAALGRVATGEVRHLHNGLCPDAVEGFGSRDPDCPAYHAMSSSQQNLALTAQQIRRSAWARRFRVACPAQYQEALALAQNVGAVSIEQRDDHSAKGDFTWAVIPDANPEFWLDGLPTKEKALSLCGRMHWPVKNA